MNNPSHQDWESVSWGGAGRSSSVSKGAKNAQLAAAARSGTLASEKKYEAGGNKSSHHGHMNMRKLEEETEVMKHQRVDAALSKALQQARLGKKMTQKQLATAINEKPQVIGEYESGKAIPNPAVISKIERALGCRLPRPNKKK